MNQSGDNSIRSRASTNKPLGQGQYLVEQGDCISSIAAATGHFWQTIWDDPANSELRRVRQNPNVLMPYDRVTIPEIRPREENCATEKTHRFRRKGEPSRLRMRFLFRGEPRSNQPYRIEIDGGPIKKGRLDGDGLLDIGIPGTSRQACVIVGEGNDVERYIFRLGGVDPIDTISGVQQRLQNLGYTCPRDGLLDDGTRAAIRDFQKDREIEASGEPNDATCRALVDAHQS
jgi:hypothetical protein